MGAFLIAAAIIGHAGYDAAVAAAKADYNAAALKGVYSQRYLYVGTLPPEKRPAAVTALNFWLPHLSRVQAIEHAIPVRITQDVYRIDLDQLAWGRAAWQELAKEYPYQHADDPLIIRGDWLLHVTTDASRSQAYFTLLYAGLDTPKNKAEFFKVWSVDDKGKDRSGIVLDEGDSGVARRTRLIEFNPSKNVHSWQTFDTSIGVGAADAMEQLGGTVKHEAQEFIIGSVVFSKKSGREGLVQRYFLANAKGESQNAAPIAIVEDYQKFCGQADIRVPGSCVQCHKPTNSPKVNTPRVWIANGVLVSTKDPAKQREIDAYYFRDYAVRHQRAAEDFASFTIEACGCLPREAVSAWSNVIHFYDGKVSLEQAAREVYAKDAEELRLAIGYYSELIGPQPGVARLTSLSHGFAVSRGQFEGNRKQKAVGVFELAQKSLLAWRAAQ